MRPTRYGQTGEDGDYRAVHADQTYAVDRGARQSPSRFPFPHARRPVCQGTTITYALGEIRHRGPYTDQHVYGRDLQTVLKPAAGVCFSLYEGSNQDVDT